MFRGHKYVVYMCINFVLQLEKASQPACITKDLCVRIHGRESRPTPPRSLFNILMGQRPAVERWVTPLLALVSAPHTLPPFLFCSLTLSWRAIKITNYRNSPPPECARKPESSLSYPHVCVVIDSTHHVRLRGLWCGVVQCWQHPCCMLLLLLCMHNYLRGTHVIGATNNPEYIVSPPPPFLCPSYSLLSLFLAIVVSVFMNSP